MKLHYIDEPELEFGGGGRHIDIRHGLAEHGPLDRGLPKAPQAVRLGVVGAAKNVEDFRAWVDRCRDGVEGKKSHRTTLFVAFDGFGEGRPLCDFVVDDRLTDIISGGDVHRIAEAGDGFGSGASDRYRQGAADLIEKANADVIACLLPDEFVRCIDVPSEPEKGPRSRRRGRGRDAPVWHDVFKAAALTLARPVQVVRPAIYGGGVRRYTRDGRPVREMQDEATRAWNFFCALYYKAGGIPWRLLRESSDVLTCFVGISFYDDPASETLRTSVAQVFNERGEGMIVRGGAAQIDERDRSPHLSAADTQALILRAVKEFRREHRTPPARLVCHKSSYFSDQELRGAKEAVTELGLDSYDLVSLRAGGTRLYRTGSYPPLRGMVAMHDDGCLLYTQGSVDFYRCYPGLYAPRALDVELDYSEEGAISLMTEILALTKMNWNSTELINLEPITLAAARSVGGILRHVPSGAPMQSRFSFFM